MKNTNIGRNRSWNITLTKNNKTLFFYPFVTFLEVKKNAIFFKMLTPCRNYVEYFLYKLQNMCISCIFLLETWSNSYYLSFGCKNTSNIWNLVEKKILWKIMSFLSNIQTDILMGKNVQIGIFLVRKCLPYTQYYSNLQE